VLRSPSDTARRLDALLRDLGPQLRRGGRPTEPLPRFPTGIPDLDRLLGGGFPHGRLSEIAGPPSSGRTSLALCLLAQATRVGEMVAVVDAADAFDPASAQAAGVRLDRVLWARAPGWREALRSAERLLEAHGFALVLLDLPSERITSAVCSRLVRAAAAAGTALVVLSTQRMMGASSELAVELRATRTHFTGTPTLFEGLEIEAALVRHSSAPTQRSARVRLHSAAAA
jgi:RecA/RadA recombinase